MFQSPPATISNHESSVASQPLIPKKIHPITISLQGPRGPPGPGTSPAAGRCPGPPWPGGHHR